MGDNRALKRVVESEDCGIRSRRLSKLRWTDTVLGAEEMLGLSKTGRKYQVIENNGKRWR